MDDIESINADTVLELRAWEIRKRCADPVVSA